VVKRLVDVIGACLLLVVVAPVLALCALVIRLTGRGPVLFHATRAGVGGAEFTMYKLRTMHHQAAQIGSRITAMDDPRISKFGKILRKIHLDELPQLVNVLKGDMSLVGPRPEDMEIVTQRYTPGMWATLDVRPGMTSPGALFAYISGHDLLEGHDDPETDYAENVLALKLGFELVYIERQSLTYDFRVLVRTARLLAWLAVGRGEPPDLPEYNRAVELSATL
jgi:lipopolysaccharide/colanic/teichoic acid biosynthesis glycosyltransferase